ncbi:sulfatase family protein [Arenibacter palladensis]|uniref:sulfatase family protein n=1 Tax=Arenibacter palladensis TaxID=237373 RepID=UPI0026E38A94|nr:sulfatase-like hydrolase/transferase [Arenibacter palladensis]MDO6603883.1 sulfatase-like hydrolase/transferase [Arenibacter palladensis]
MKSIYFRKITPIFICFFLFACEEREKLNTVNKEDVAGLPNIIILLADDLGYGDLSIYGSQSIETPNIDALAREGMRFSQFYSGSAVCSPSRACLLTGKYPLRYDIRQHFNDNEEHLPETSITLPELLRDNGYKTVHIGKWHLGGLRPIDYEARAAGNTANPGPLQHGFDHYLSSIEGAPIRPKLLKERKLYREGGKYMIRNDRRADTIYKHWTEIKVDEAISKIDIYQNENAPFFVNLWFDVPHTPYEPAPEPHLSKYKKLGATGDQLYFRSMVSHLDANIGRLISYLKEKGIFENTIILFTSDNGPAFQGSPGPFSGGKTDLHEGGLRVPMLAVWKGRIPENTHSFNTLHMADILPTLADAVGINIDNLEIDGISALPLLENNNYVEREALYWQMDLYKGFQNQGPKPHPYATSGIVQGKWKMLMDSTGPAALYDLAQDHRELYNLKGKHPFVEKELSSKLKDFLMAKRDTTGFIEVK